MTPGLPPENRTPVRVSRQTGPLRDRQTGALRGGTRNLDIWFMSVSETDLKPSCWVQWHAPAISDLGRQRQEDLWDRLASGQYSSVSELWVQGETASKNKMENN